MRYFSDTHVTVVPTGDTVMTLGISIATRIYLSDSKVPRKAIGRYCSGVRIPVETSRDTLVALGYQWGHRKIV